MNGIPRDRSLYLKVHILHLTLIPSTSDTKNNNSQINAPNSVKNVSNYCLLQLCQNLEHFINFCRNLFVKSLALIIKINITKLTQHWTNTIIKICTLIKIFLISTLPSSV